MRPTFPPRQYPATLASRHPAQPPNASSVRPPRFPPPPNYQYPLTPYPYHHPYHSAPYPYHRPYHPPPYPYHHPYHPAPYPSHSPHHPVPSPYHRPYHPPPHPSHRLHHPKTSSDSHSTKQQDNEMTPHRHIDISTTASSNSPHLPSSSSISTSASPLPTLCPASITDSTNSSPKPELDVVTVLSESDEDNIDVPSKVTERPVVRTQPRRKAKAVSKMSTKGKDPIDNPDPDNNPGPSKSFLKSNPSDRLDFNLQRVIFHTDSQCDVKLVTKVLENVFQGNGRITWDDVAGLPKIQKQLKEMVVHPLINPQLFKGLRDPGRGLLLFGPPGTGKTLIGKCIAAEARATFFSVTASSFASKWYGEAEGLVKALFQCARTAVSQKTRTESPLSELPIFLIILMMLLGGALPSAYMSLFQMRMEEIVKRLLRKEKHELQEADFNSVAKATKGYSGADLKVVCKEAAMEPIRDLHSIICASIEDVREITVDDMLISIQKNPQTVAETQTEMYEEFNKRFGSLC